MSANPKTPLFVISDGEDVNYKDDPAITQAKANLTAAEHIQQEKAEQRRLEREEQKARVVDFPYISLCMHPIRPQPSSGVLLLRPAS